MKRPSAVILIGIPAAGKTTFYRERLFDTHLRISLDQLGSRRREELVLNACLAGGIPFASDNTNASAAVRQRFIVAARDAGFRVAGYYFSSRLPEALQRNRLRQAKARVPDAGVRGIAGRLELPAYAEGFDELWYVRLASEGGFVVESWREHGDDDETGS